METYTAGGLCGPTRPLVEIEGNEGKRSNTSERPPDQCIGERMALHEAQLWWLLIRTWIAGQHLPGMAGRVPSRPACPPTPLDAYSLEMGQEQKSLILADALFWLMPYLM